MLKHELYELCEACNLPYGDHRVTDDCCPAHSDEGDGFWDKTKFKPKDPPEFEER